MAKWWVALAAVLPLGCGGETSAERATGREPLVVDLDDCTNAAVGDGFAATEIGYEADRFWADFDATPSADAMDAVVGFSDGPAESFSDLGVAVRFNPEGFIDARDGDAYRSHSPAPLAYHAGQTYRFHLEVDFRTHTYLATVAAPDGGFAYLALGASFRSEEATALQITHRISKVDSPFGSVSVCHYSRPYGDRCLRTDAGDAFSNRRWWPTTGTAIFSATVKSTEANIDAGVGISDGASDSFSDLAATVRFNPAGVVDARNGGAYAAAAPLQYAPGAMYDVRIMLDVRRHTYSADVGGVAIAQDFAFRTEQSGLTALDDSTVFVDSPSGGLILCNPQLTSIDRAIYTVPSAFGQLAVGASGQLYEMHGSIDVRDAATGDIVSSAPRRGTGQVDGAGNLYLAGTFDDAYDPGTGVLPNAGGSDVFVAKYGPDLTPLWARSLGTAGDDVLTDMVVDGQGNAIALVPTIGTIVLDPGGAVVRESNDGASGVATNGNGEIALVGGQQGEGGNLVWVEKRSASGVTSWRNTYRADEVNGVALSDSGDVAFSGMFRGTVNFGGSDFTFRASEVNYAGYIVKLSTGGEHLWSLMNDHHYGHSSLLVDRDGNVLFAATIGSQFLEPSIAKYASATGEGLWAQAESERGQTLGIAVDGSGAAYWSFTHEDYGAGTTEGFVKKLAP